MSGGARSERLGGANSNRRDRALYGVALGFARRIGNSAEGDRP